MGERRTVLVISHDSVARDLLAVILKKDGFRVDEVETVLEARALLETRPYFACVLDARPLFAAGPELLRQLAVATPPNLVLIADEGNGETLAAAKAAGAVAVLTRPFENDAILREMRKLCPGT